MKYIAIVTIAFLIGCTPFKTGDSSETNNCTPSKDLAYMAFVDSCIQTLNSLVDEQDRDVFAFGSYCNNLYLENTDK